MTDTLCNQLKKHFEKVTCIQCGLDFHRRKDVDVKSDICESCREENMKRLVSQNVDNL